MRFPFLPKAKGLHINKFIRPTWTAGHDTRLSVSLFFAPLLLAGCGGGGGSDSGGGGNPPPATTPVARYAYVANTGDDTVSILLADNTTGQLRHHGYVQTGDGPTALTIDPSGQFAYTLNANSTDISLFTLDSLSGELVAADCNQSTGNLDTCSTGGTPVSMAFEPNGQFAYVGNQASNTLTAHAKDTATGALSSVATQPPIDMTANGGDTPVKLRVHPNGGFLYVAYDASDNVGVYQIDATNGTLTHVAGSPVASGGTAASDIAITSDGQYAFVANQSGEIGVFTIDGSGLLVANGSPLLAAGAPTPYALAIENSDHWLYMLSQEVSGNVSLFEIQSDGTLVQRDCGTAQTCPAGRVPESIAIDPTGQFLSVANRSDNTLSLFAIDQSSGQLTAVNEVNSRVAPSAVAYYTDTAEVTVTPRFAYVGNYNGFSVSAYAINASSGSLTSIGTPVGTAGKPSAVTSDLSGSYLYATNDTTDNVSVFSINSGNGTLTEISGSPFNIETNPTGPEFGPISISIDPSGRFAYVANSSDTLSAYNIDSSTGALSSFITGSPFATGDIPSAVAVDPTGRFLYNANLNADNISAFSIDATTGALSTIGTIPAGDAPNSISVDPSGRFVYVANNGSLGYSVSAYSIDPLTGGLSEIAGSPFTAGNAPISISVDPLGEFVYVAIRSLQNVTPYTIDQSTGALTAGTPVSTELNPQAITVDPSGQYVYVANGDSSSVSGYTINSSTGALTSNGSSAAGLFPRSIVTTGVIQ